MNIFIKMATEAVLMMKLTLKCRDFLVHEDEYPVKRINQKWRVSLAKRERRKKPVNS